MKRTVSLILSFAITFVFLSSGIFAGKSAACDDFIREGIINSLRFIEAEKEDYDLANVDFTELTYSAPIRTYEYTSEGAVYVNNFIPLKYNDELVAWAVEFYVENDALFQISTSYIDEINALDDIPDSYALIYDRGACYLYDGTTLRCLGLFNADIDNRIKVPSADALAGDSNIILSGANNPIPLGYTSVASSRGLVLPVSSYSCNVEYISQLPHDKLCWAASIACILRYNYNKSYTMEEVVKEKFNGHFRNEGLYPGDAPDIINRFGDIEYTYIGTISSARIINSLKNDYPICGVFFQNNDPYNATHVAVICRCLCNNANEVETIRVMDPFTDKETFFNASKTPSSSYFTYFNTYADIRYNLGAMVIKK